jgi:hypothetical protein
MKRKPIKRIRTDRAAVFDVLDELTIYLVRHYGVISLDHPTLQRAKSILAAGGGENHE